MKKVEVPFVKVPTTKIVVASVGNGSLLIRDDLGNCFIVTNPANPGVFAHNVKWVEVSDKTSSEDILNAIDRHGEGR